MQNYENSTEAEQQEGENGQGVAQAHMTKVGQAMSGRKNKAQGAFLTISEVADQLGVQQHVLRFWETKFSHIRPLKRGGGRRYYRPEDVDVLKMIQHLLYTEGYTIKGVQKMLKAQGKKKVMQALPLPLNANEQNGAASDGAESSVVVGDQAASRDDLDDVQKQALRAMLTELRTLRSLVASEE